VAFFLLGRLAMSVTEPTPISGPRLVSALERAGFVVFRRHAIATLLERGLRAVAVPNQRVLPPQAIRSVRQMSGLSAHELDELLRDWNASEEHPGDLLPSARSAERRRD
jgi:hypothetical protein